MEETKHPPEVRLFGQSMKKEGYIRGYNQCVYDYRRQRSKRERFLQIRFGLIWDKIDDMISAQKKR